jgi:hypothetical protein
MFIISGKLPSDLWGKFTSTPFPPGGVIMRTEDIATPGKGMMVWYASN